jgi:predicted Zn-dependent peptidase
LAVLQVPLEQPPRLRTILPNGAVILVERMPEARFISVQLFASSRTVKDTPETHGHRHLLEHLVATGKGQDLDRRLETKGMYLRASTLRDAMRFEVLGSASQLQEGISALSEILQPLETTQERIDREVPVLQAELLMQEDSALLGNAAWKQAYGDAGLDPLGTMKAMKIATPDALRTLQRKQFYAENLVVVVAGPVDLDDATKRVAALIGGRQGAVRTADTPRAPGKPGRVESASFGEGRGALVGGFQEMRTVATLALALAVASDFEGSFVTYTPTAQNGLIIVGQTSTTSGVGLRLDEITGAISRGSSHSVRRWRTRGSTVSSRRLPASATCAVCCLCKASAIGRSQ